MSTPDQDRRGRLAAALGPAKRVLALVAAYGVLMVIMGVIRDHPRDSAGTRLLVFLWLGLGGMFFFGALAFGITKHFVDWGLRPSQRRWLVCFAATFVGAAWLLLVRGLQLGRAPEEWGVILFIAAISAPVLRLSKVTRI